MFRFLGLYSKYKFMFWVGEFFYYSINLSAIILGWHWVGRKLKEMGYGSKKMNLYVLLCLLISFPVGFASSRAAGMFYHPASKWSLDFLLENMLHGKTHTYHASLILPILVYLIYGLIFRFKLWHLLDTVFMYIPLGHAIGRVSCLIVGCCWGHRVTVHLLGLNLSFQNPTPLWAIGMNLCIFYFLKQLHGQTYLNPSNPHNHKGAIAASYLVLYGVDRFFMEIFRTERVIFLGLTQAQITMLIYMSIGFAIFAFIKFRRETPAESSFVGRITPDNRISRFLAGFVLINLCPLLLYYLYKIYYLLFMLIMQKKGPAFEKMAPSMISVLIGLSVALTILFYCNFLRKEDTASSDGSPDEDRKVVYPENIRPLILLASYVALTLFLLSLFHYLVMKMRFLPFPFQRVNDITTAYKLIFTYLPFLILPIISIIWLKKAQLPILEKFKIQGNSKKTIIIFTTIGLAASIFYSLDLLVFREPRLRGAAFWPPVLILSIINAFTEEIAYRLTTYSLILNANLSRITAILLQAILYSSVHFFFNPSLGVLAFFYGIIMGVLMDRTQSVTLCIICHFVIDLGAIGRPILAY